MPFGHLYLRGLEQNQANYYLNTLYGENWDNEAANYWLDFSKNLVLPKTVKVPLTKNMRNPARSRKDPMHEIMD